MVNIKYEKNLESDLMYGKIIREPIYKGAFFSFPLNHLFKIVYQPAFFHSVSDSL